MARRREENRVKMKGENDENGRKCGESKMNGKRKDETAIKCLGGERENILEEEA